MVSCFGPLKCSLFLPEFASDSRVSPPSRRLPVDKLFQQVALFGASCLEAFWLGIPLPSPSSHLSHPCPCQRQWLAAMAVARNQKSCNFDFQLIVWGLGTRRVFYRLLASFHRSLGCRDAAALPSAKMKGKERLYPLDPSFVVLGSSHVIWGVHLRADASWQRPKNGLHSL